MRLIPLVLGASAGAIIFGVVIIVLNMGTITNMTNNLPENFGIIVNSPTQDIKIVELDALYAKSASLGSTRSNVYIFWNTFEPEPGKYSWALTDAIMSLHARHNLDATIFFSLVNGKTFGPLPDWMGRPTLDAIPAKDVAAAVSAIVSRYPEIVDSVIIAGDADAHFESNFEMIDAYNLIFDSVRKELKLTNPDVKIGNAFSLDRILNRGTQNIPSMISQGDFVAFTYRPVNILNEISKDSQQARQDLEKMSHIADGLPIALFEVGWSTSEAVFGSPKDQAEFADEIVEFTNTTAIEFVTWYRLHDKPEGTCHIATSQDTGFLVTDSGKYSATNLGEYLCSAGILDPLGGQKAGWDALAAQ